MEFCIISYDDDSIDSLGSPPYFSSFSLCEEGRFLIQYLPTKSKPTTKGSHAGFLHDEPGRHIENQVTGHSFDVNIRVYDRPI